jgi:hypothetical protein
MGFSDVGNPTESRILCHRILQHRILRPHQRLPSISRPRGPS